MTRAGLIVGRVTRVATPNMGVPFLLGGYAGPWRAWGNGIGGT